MSQDSIASALDALKMLPRQKGKRRVDRGLVVLAALVAATAIPFVAFVLFALL